MFYPARLIAFTICSLMLASAIFAQGVPAGQSKSAAQPVKKNGRPASTAKQTAPAEPFDGAKVDQMTGQCVTLETTAGAIEIEMLPEAAPETVRNFLNLSAIGAYDTTMFSRVVKDFVIQGGSFPTREKITPELALRMARKISDEPNYIKHVRGVVSMARAAEPNSASSSFFILVGDGPHLDGKFAAFGRVVRGMDVADTINQAPTDGEKPLKPVRLTRATVAPCARPANPAGGLAP